MESGPFACGIPHDEARAVAQFRTVVVLRAACVADVERVVAPFLQVGLDGVNGIVAVPYVVAFGQVELDVTAPLACAGIGEEYTPVVGGAFLIGLVVGADPALESVGSVPEVLALALSQFLPLATVTSMVAVWPVAVHVAVITAEPKPTGVTTPRFTVATDSLLDSHCTDPAVPLLGV